VALRSKRLVRFKVDRHIAAENYIIGSARRHALAQLEGGEIHHAALRARQFARVEEIDRRIQQAKLDA
jgi:hypothetical protein